MGDAISNSGFTIWGADQTPYGPIELPALVTWIKEERVTADTWIFVNNGGAWSRAVDVPELQMFFRRKSATSGRAGGATLAADVVDSRQLRRIRMLATLTEEQLERFATFVDVQTIAPFSVVVKQGEPGDAMYFILDGELRVRMTVAGKETILATLGPGEMFGDIALFDRGPRSADVVANTESLVVRFSAEAFDRLAAAAPDLATPLLRAIGKTLTARIRADNKRYGDSIRFSRVG